VTTGAGRLPGVHQRINGCGSLGKMEL